jgi:hypothetical protein
LAIRASARVNNSGSEDLWLSATGAVVNGGRWLRPIERRSEKLVPDCRRHRAVATPVPVQAHDGAAFNVVHQDKCFDIRHLPPAILGFSRLYKLGGYKNRNLPCGLLPLAAVADFSRPRSGPTSGQLIASAAPGGCKQLLRPLLGWAFSFLIGTSGPVGITSAPVASISNASPRRRRAARGRWSMSGLFPPWSACTAVLPYGRYGRSIAVRHPRRKYA